MRMLLVEDDAVLSDIMKRNLNDFGHQVDLAMTLDEARHAWQVHVYDCVLLDLTLPVSIANTTTVGNSLTVLREVRARGDQTPVLVLTARNRTDERIAGLDAGADDYIGKPFDLAEVEARLRAVARRSQATADHVEIGSVALVDCNG